MSDLFLDHTNPLVFTKLSMPVKLSDNADNWQKEIAAEIHRQVPFLANYAANVLIDRADPARGYAYGSIEVSNKSDAPEANQKELPKITIPLLIKERTLQPLDIFLDGKEAFPLSERRVSEHLMRTDSVELSTRKPQDQGLVDALYPPLRTNYGYGNSVSTGTGGMGKFAGASFLKSIASTISEREADEFIAKIASDPALSLAAACNETFRKLAFAVASAPRVGVEKTAAALVSTIKPTVVQITKQADGNFLVKWANAGAFAPQQDTVGPDQAASLMGDRVVQAEPGKPITVSTDKVKKTTLEQDKLEQVRDFGQYRTQNADTNEPLVGWVMPVMDLDMQPMPLYVFSNGQMYGAQDEIAGSRIMGSMDDFMALFTGGMPKMAMVGGSNVTSRFNLQSRLLKQELGQPSGQPKVAADEGMQPGGAADPAQAPQEPMPEAAPEPPAPQGDGTFVSIVNERAVCLPPMTIKATTTSQEGDVSYQIEDVWGDMLSLSIAPGAQEIMEIEPGHYTIPDTFMWLPLQNSIHLVKDPNQMQKIAGARNLHSIVEIRNTGIGEYHLAGMPVSQLGPDATQFLKAAEAEFLLVAGGMSPTDAREKLAEAKKYHLVKAAGLRTIVPLSALHDQMVKKAAAALLQFPHHLRQDLIKEAAAFEDEGTADAILSMNFINPENIAAFAANLPQLDEASSKVAEMLLASRMGLSQIPEGACERSMKALEEVIDGLRGLEQRTQA